jgi:hypothetical protein
MNVREAILVGLPAADDRYLPISLGKTGTETVKIGTYTIPSIVASAAGMEIPLANLPVVARVSKSKLEHRSLMNLVTVIGKKEDLSAKGLLETGKTMLHSTSIGSITPTGRKDTFTRRERNMLRAREIIIISNFTKQLIRRIRNPADILEHKRTKVSINKGTGLFIIFCFFCCFQ